MKALKRIVIGLLLLLGLLCLVSLMLPRTIHLERSTVINAPQADVFDRVDDFTTWNEWSPWYAMEPTAKYSYSEITKGTGAKMSWVGESVGSGSQTITVSIPYESISASLEFSEGGPATADWQFAADGNSTRVVWKFDTDLGMNPISKFFGLMLPGMLGAQYDEGLANLKRICERDASAGQTSTDSTPVPSVDAAETAGNVSPPDDATAP